MPYFATLGMFIVDEFAFLDEAGNPTPTQPMAPQIGGGGTYACIGARVWLSASQVGMIIDRGSDFPPAMENKLAGFGQEMWFYRTQLSGTTRAINTYRGDHRSFDYITPRIRITPKDLQGTRLENSTTLHFICSPSRASTIMSEVQQMPGWNPTVIYEPIPDRCVPEELDALVQVLPQINILSPNAEEALGLLSLPLPPSKKLIEEAAHKFLELGVGPDGKGSVVIRSGSMGACVALKGLPTRWVPAFWTSKDEDKIVDVTGAGNSFLGGLAAGLLVADGDVYEASFHASVAASFVIEQTGLPNISLTSGATLWNGDRPERRLDELKKRQVEVDH
ncbi:Ribokinase-like protein [Mycena albidolilacea]|uniref:Ribokinase-like protein n=1 Tax=Mycena albidolilacea TaxID=1033008 RepID=A0AAD7AUB1_9AGAR|nr:Ribokinase-like protein [Mycena albidolilacea]